VSPRKGTQKVAAQKWDPSQPKTAAVLMVPSRSLGSAVSSHCRSVTDGAPAETEFGALQK